MKQLIILALLLIAAPTEGKPRKQKHYNSGKAFCPHIHRQAYGTAVGWFKRGAVKKAKRHRLAEYQ